MHRAPVLPATLAAVAAAFPLPGRFVAGVPHGSGHINDTFAAIFEQDGRTVRYILQRINDRIFRDVPALMGNISRVTAQVGRRMAERGGPDVGRRALTLVPARDGLAWHRDPAGGWWRCYVFIEGARTHDLIEHPGQARAAARAFGEFQGMLTDLPGGRLHEIIPHFHDTRRRFDTLQRVAAADPQGRAAAAAADLAFAREREDLVDVLQDLQARGAMTERVTHNDTKLNNVMIDDVTGEGICVIDLDSVMPGLALHDFGDMVRSATNSAMEDEPDQSRISMRLPIFAALVEGYVPAVRAGLTDAELAHLACAGRIITLEIGMRFLTDFLEGDVYFKTKRPGHNLDRARNQFALLRSMEAQRSAMEEAVDAALGRSVRP